MKLLRIALALVIASFAGVLLVRTASAQGYPSSSITFIVPYAAGGSADIVARLIGAKLQDQLGQSVVIENRPGGSEIVAAELVARSAPDGHTIAILSNALAINETLVPNRRYDARKDLTGVARVIELPFAIMVHPSVPATTIADLVAHAKAHPGKLNYGHLGPGSPHFFTMEWFKRAAGVDILPVPYRGAAPAYAALVAGEVQVIASGLGAATPFLEAKQARPLAALSARRPASLPTLPTIMEAGFSDFSLSSWMAIFVRSGTPADVVNKLQDEVLRAMEDAEIRNRLAKLGLEVSPMRNREFSAFFDNEIANWRSIVQATASPQKQ